MKRLPIVLLLAGCPGSDSDTDGESGTSSDTEPTPTSSSTSPSTTATTPGTGETTTSPTDTMTMSGTTEAPMTTGSGSDSSSGSGSGSTTTGGVGACPYKEVDGDPGVALEEVADGFRQPVLVVGDPVDTDVLYVVQKGGAIKRLEDGDTMAPAADWLDVDVDAGGEGGLLGLAFHPDYDTNGLMYIASIPVGIGGPVLVTEYEVDDEGEVDLDSDRPVIAVGQSQNNHNGGMIQFGPDDMLYVSIGDGGVQYDACEHGQDTDSLLAKILRIDPAADGDPDTTPPCNAGPGCPCSGYMGFDYTIPDDNPFVGMGGFRDEIYAYGFRNAWRFSFDPEDGRLWVADVGQDFWEEVSVIEAGDNAGWGDMEANHCHSDGGCDTTADPGDLNADGLRIPVIEYSLAGTPCAVIGLGNYRSCEVPGWAGRYFYADACSGEVFSVSYDGVDVTDHGEVADLPENVYGGGYNAYGDVFIATATAGTSAIYRVAPD